MGKAGLPLLPKLWLQRNLPPPGNSASQFSVQTYNRFLTYWPTPAAVALMIIWFLHLALPNRTNMHCMPSNSFSAFPMLATGDAVNLCVSRLPSAKEHAERRACRLPPNLIPLASKQENLFVPVNRLKAEKFLPAPPPHCLLLLLHGCSQTISSLWGMSLNYRPLLTWRHRVNIPDGLEHDALYTVSLTASL